MLWTYDLWWNNVWFIVYIYGVKENGVVMLLFESQNKDKVIQIVGQREVRFDFSKSFVGWRRGQLNFVVNAYGES